MDFVLPAQEQLNTKIGKIIPNSPAAAAQLHVGDKIIAVDGKETTTWEKLNFALIDRVGETGTVNIDVDRAGSEKILYYQLKIFKNQNESALDVLGFLPYRPVIPAVVTELMEDGAAIRQGMKVGDRIVAIDGQPMKDWFDVVEVVQRSPEKLLKIDVLRHEQLVHLQVMPQGKRDSMGQVNGVLGVKVMLEKLQFLTNISKQFNILQYKLLKWHLIKLAKSLA